MYKIISYISIFFSDKTNGNKIYDIFWIRWMVKLREKSNGDNNLNTKRVYVDACLGSWILIHKTSVKACWRHYSTYMDV
jgi:hypothetical protein